MAGDTALFISDVHLLPGGPGAEARTRAFADFVAGAARSARTLYVLGDLFSYWFESRGRVPRGFDRACSAIREATVRGLRVVALPGNRDFLLGREFARRTGAEVARDNLVMEFGESTVLLTHGDSLAADDHRYQLWKRLSRAGTFRRLARGVPPWAAERVAAALRAGSEAEKRVKQLGAMAYSDRALRARVACGADVIVAGHVHDAGERAVEAGGRVGRVLTLGAWGVTPGAHAEWDGEDLRLVR